MPFGEKIVPVQDFFVKSCQGTIIEKFLRDDSFTKAMKFTTFFFIKRKLVGLRGLEPPTLRLSGVRSNHLSYKPI